MQEHALPQDVTGYKFHIIGNMTLKQFGEVGAGCILGFILYQTNLPFIIKIPLIVISAGAGAMIAFVPLEERPLDQWIGAFFRALYRPTQYYWKRVPKIPEPFLYVPKTEMRSVVADVDLTPARRQRVKDYLRSIDEQGEEPDQLDQYTDQRLGEVMNQFGEQLHPQLSYIDEGTTQNTPAIDESEALLSANPDSISEAVDHLSFAGRGASEEIVTQPELTPEETEMSNNILNLFDTPDQTQIAPEPDVIPPLPEPVLPPLPVIEPTLPPKAEPKVDRIPEAVTISVPKPPVAPPPPPEPIPEPIIEPLPEPETIPLIAPEPVAEAHTSITETPAPKEVPQKTTPLAEDLTSIPDVSLEPEEDLTPPQTEVPQISTIFDASLPPLPSTPRAESIPKVETVNKYSATIPPASGADSSEVADVADVIAMNAGNARSHIKGKSTFSFKKKQSSDMNSVSLPHIIDMTGSSQSVILEKPAPVEHKQAEVTKEVIVPELQDIMVERTVEEPKKAGIAGSGQMSTAADPATLDVIDRQNNITVTSAVKYNPELPFPDKPTQNNKVVGMVIDQAGNSLAGAIVEILSTDGIPARAVKTNPLGQFFIATPLNKGEYLITAEKEGMTFPTQQLSVINKLIDPIEIRAN